MKYKIVADSSANIRERERGDFSSVPLRIVTARKEYVDTKDLDVARMVEELQAYKGKSGTSCPNIHDWLEAFGGADVVLAVTITSGLSGSYASGAQAAAEYEETHPGSRVLVVDSLSAGPEMELLIEKMEEAVSEGLSFEQIREVIGSYRKKTHLLFALEHLDNLSRNGRVNPLLAKMAGVFGIRMVGKASDAGILQPLHKCRGAARTTEVIWEEMLAHGYCGGKVRLAHCLNPDAAQALADMIRTRFPEADILIRPTAGLCSFYAEKGGLMIGYEG